MRPFPVILSAPSGGGKTTIAKRLLAERADDLGYSVSCTTRGARAGEVDGRDYYFLPVEDFLARRDRSDFAEWAEVHGNLYGTLRSEVERVLAGGRHVIMDIDVQGARKFAAAFPEAVLIFVLPPSAEVLVSRLSGRSTESSGALAVRLRNARDEIAAVYEYEYVVVNEDLDDAVRRVGAIIDAESARRDRRRALRTQVDELIAQLDLQLGHLSPVS